MVEVNLALTADGQALRAKIELGNGTIPLTITRIVIGSGTDADPLHLSAVVNEELEFTITDRQTNGARTSITAIATNAGNPSAGILPLSRGFPMSQVGFYANDPDKGEILYRISQYDNPNYVPAAKERGWTYQPTYNFVSGNASEVIVNIDPAGFSTKTDIWNSIELSANDTPNAGVREHLKIIKQILYWTGLPDPTDPPDELEVFPGSLLHDNGETVNGMLKTSDGELKSMMVQ